MSSRALLCLIALAFAGCKPDKVTERDAETIFKSQCAKCHGPQGTGDPKMKVQLGVRDLTDAAWQATITDAQIRQSIKKGKKNMPSWGAVLDDAQVESLLAKVRALRK